MKKLVLRELGIIFISTAAVTAAALGQARLGAVSDVRIEYSSEELLKEVRLARNTLEHLNEQLVQLEVLATQIRLQMDAVKATEARIEAVKSEIHSVEQHLSDLKARARNLEADVASENEEEQRRRRLQVQKTKKEIELNQQKLDLHRSHELQLRAKLHTEQANLNHLLSRLNELSGVTAEPNTESKKATECPSGSQRTKTRWSRS